jgi:hypothetical protein
MCCLVCLQAGGVAARADWSRIGCHISTTSDGTDARCLPRLLGRRALLTGGQVSHHAAAHRSLHRQPRGALSAARGARSGHAGEAAPARRTWPANLIRLLAALAATGIIAGGRYARKREVLPVRPGLLLLASGEPHADCKAQR